MDLAIQLQVLVVSFLYGILFSYLLKIQYHFFFEGKRLYRIMITFFFMIDNCFLYFLILRTINHGIFHIYFLFIIILGFLLGNYLLKKK